MRKTLAIVFLGLYLLTATDFKQFFKLPNLIGHYLDHDQKESDLHFFSFFLSHYFNGGLVDEDFHEDMKLPFKSFEDVIGSSLSIFIPISNASVLMKPDAFINRKLSPPAMNCHDSGHEDAIWQPPQIS